VARAIQIGGLENNGAAWLKELVGGIMATTPHSWPSHTLQNFPPVSLRTFIYIWYFFQKHPVINFSVYSFYYLFYKILYI
jgi:Mediator complex subunit 23